LSTGQLNGLAGFRLHRRASGEAHDNRLCSVLLAGLRPQTIVLANRGYDADWLRQFVREQGERFFNKIKQCRRIATRCDKLAVNYLAFIKLASIRLWIRAYESTP
jgi:transposase